MRAALQATLVKRAEDVGVFELLFDRHFPADAGATAGPVVRVARCADGDQPAESAAGRLRAPAGGSRSPSSMPSAAVTTRRSSMLADEAVARYSGIETQPGSERYFLYRVMRALDLSNLLIAVMARQRSEHPDSSEFELRQLRDDVAQRIERLRRLLAAAVRKPARRRGHRPRHDVPCPGGSRTSTFWPRRRPSSTNCACCRPAARPQAGQPGRSAASSPSPRQPRRAAHDASIARRRGHPARPGAGGGRGGPSRKS